MQNNSKWEYIRSLGEGGFGEVHQWKNKETGQEIATKSLKPNKNLKPDEVDTLKKRWLQEAMWMKALKTKFIVAASQIEDNEFLQYLQEQNHWKMLPVIVMEYCNGGDLRSVLERVDNTYGLSEKVIRDVLKTLRYGIEYLHNKCNIEHRDIKPENIVINQMGNGKIIYKLTDFGYARDIPEETIAQSVVGTRHYVAPEVIDPGCYTKTVDYWSAAVLAFEIICGFRPFIPHRNMHLILTNIIAKPRKCIAITQCIDDLEADRFVFEEKLKKENKCSPIFKSKIEKWLALAMDNDYKQRGFEKGQLHFYTVLDAILATSILSVYSLKSCSFHYYDINMYSDISMFLQRLSEDTQIPQNSMFLTFPVSHPKQSLHNIKEPREFFVPEWLDPYDPGNQPAMLYVSDMAQCDYNLNPNEYFNHVPKIINVCMEIDQEKYDSLPKWLLDQFEREVHFLLSEQQRYLECHMSALFDYITSVEQLVFNFQSEVNKVRESTILLNGQVLQFERFVRMLSQISGVENSEFMLVAKKFNKDCEMLNKRVASNIFIRFQSLYNHCKALSSKDIYKKLPQRDIFKLKSFRRYLIETNLSNSLRMKECVKAFDAWTMELTNFARNPEIMEIHKEITAQVGLFCKMQKAACDSLALVKRFEEKLTKETSNLLNMILSQELQMKMSSLNINGIPAENGISSLSESLFLPSNHLIQDTNELISSIQKNMMEVDENVNICDNIPTTVQDI